MAAGRCRFCGCTEINACPGGCYWIDAREDVCNQCDLIALAWQDLPRKSPNMVAAFFRGFVQASGDLRVRRFVVVTDAPDGGNPYPARSKPSLFFEAGAEAGRRVAELTGAAVRSGR